MHKIITINGCPDSTSAPGVNGYLQHHHHATNSHKRLTTSTSSTTSLIRNGSYRENGALLGGEQVNRVRNSKKKKMDWRKLFASFLAFSLPVVFPTIHMYIFNNLWGHMKAPVDKKQCSCSCWDSVFKGPYEVGIAKYKHVYFNSDATSLKMWTITVLAVLFLYESFKRLFSLLFARKLRWSMAFLFLSSLHSHYYAWWGHWNYWNDDFYQMWYHQLFFTVTEMVSSLLVLNYLDARRGIEPIPMFVVCSIAVFHTFCSGWDQFVFNFVQGQGQLHQIMRDLMLMVTDIVHATLSFHEIRIYAVRKGVSLFSLLINRTHLTVVLIVTVVMYICVLLFP